MGKQIEPNEPERHGEPKKRSGGRALMFVLLAAMLLLFFSSLFKTLHRDNEISLDRFMESVRAGFHTGPVPEGTATVRSMKINPEDQLIKGEYNDPIPAGKQRSFTVHIPVDFASSPFMEEIAKLNKEADNPIKISFIERNPWKNLLFTLVPWILLFAFFWFFVFRQFRSAGGAGGVLSFGKSRATLFTKEKPKTTFKDVAGIEEASDEVKEIVEFLKYPEKFQRLGGRIPKGVLLIGPPGTGKTLLARAIAGEANVPFFSISGSDFVEMFVGVGASRVRDLFLQAKQNSPCIIFLDEIDAVGRRRGTGLGGGHDEREQTLNAILVEMDGFDSDHRIVIIAATNRQDVLDPALLRPGRFDRHVFIDLPDIRGREEILRVHAARVLLGDDVNLKTIARSTPGFSGADIENLINESALIAAMNGHDTVEMQDFEQARDKVLFGRAKHSRVIDPDEKKITSYHEAGHALVGYYNPNSDMPHKITVIPHGQAIGMTSFLPEKERHDYSRKKLMAILEVIYGGRVAEELYCDDISAGASNDILRATNIAREMVTSFGMSDKLGPLHYGENSETLFLGREVTRSRHSSEETSRLIDEEITRIIREAYDSASRLLKEKSEQVHLLAGALIDRETVSYDELVELLDSGVIAGDETSSETEGEAKNSAGETSGTGNENPAADASENNQSSPDVSGSEGLAPA